MRFSLILYYKRYQNYDRSKLKYLDLLRGCPYLTSDDRGSGGPAKSDFITKEALIKCLMRGEEGLIEDKNHLTLYMDGTLTKIELSTLTY